jgi:hypothetical protein
MGREVERGGRRREREEMYCMVLIRIRGLGQSTDWHLVSVTISK